MNYALRRLVFVVLGSFLAAHALRAQDTTTTPGVRLGLSYAAGSKPGVIVLPVQDDDNDSLRAIVQRESPVAVTAVEEKVLRL